MMEDTQRLTNYYIAKANDELRTRLAQADQQIEWLSKENTSLKRHAEEVTTGLLELRSVTSEALDTIRKRVAHDAAEIEKWRERYHGLSTELAAQLDGACRNRDRNSLRIVELENNLDRCERDGERLRNEIKALKGRPGTMSFGLGGLYIFSRGTPPQEVLDAAESLRAEHFRNMEDEWYSCPKSGECWRDLPDDLCTCGADATNAAVDVVLAYLKGEAT